MDNNETENLISEMLNSQKPDKNVLSSAKNVMAKNKPGLLRIKKQFYALAGCSALFIIIGVIFAVLNQYNNAYETNSLNEAVANNALGFDNGLFIAAIILMSIGVVFAGSAIIIRAVKTKAIYL